MQGKISRRKLAQHVVDASSNAGGIADALRDVAAYLIDTKRLREAELVVRAIEDEFAARGIVVAHVATARALTAELTAAITTIIDAREVHINETVDADLVGGVRIETPGKLLDATVKRKLLALRQAKI